MRRIFACFFAIFLIFFAIFSVQFVYSLLFPIKFEEFVSSASAEFGVDEAVIFSCINIESRFNPNATSSRGAIGLMQMMPSTATDLSDEAVIDLTDPQTSITLGTKYLSILISRFGSIETAICAYNAGPTTVSGWLSNAQYSSDGVTLDEIPYAETEQHLAKFQKNLKYYRSKLGLSLD